MKAVKKNEITQPTMISKSAYDSPSLEVSIKDSWSMIPPLWPLKNFIAVNPIAGFEHLPFEEGLKQAKAYFQQKTIPKTMKDVNRESIKWLQAFFDQGQSTIHMPNRQLGFLKSTLSLLKFDKPLHKNHPQKLQWLQSLPQKPEAIIAEALLKLGVMAQEQKQFLTLMLTTLPGWAAYIQYRTNWADEQDAASQHTVTQSEYLAFRLVLTYLLGLKADTLIAWHQKALSEADIREMYDEIISNEASYQSSLLRKFENREHAQQTTRPKAQLVFCIDVRSEPLRRALESQGNYETYGFAGFFGVPVAIENSITNESYASCPILLKPAYRIIERPKGSHQSYYAAHKRLQGIKKVYQSLKYNLTTPFSLAEVMGIANGLWMALRSLCPNTAEKIQSRLKNTTALNYETTPDIKAIPFEQQVIYGASILKIMGLTENFSPLIVFCGHGSTTQNNAYATALDCGACGGRHGGSNARILAAILNTQAVRQALIKQGIVIPDDTLFVAAEHNTTTDEVTLYTHNLCEQKAKQISELKRDLEKSRNKNSLRRMKQMGVHSKKSRAWKLTALRAQDWAQVRPEWGLAKNAAFIVAPRAFTKNIDLEGRSFLHSYDWQKDKDGSSLSSILTAPMVVAQWINSQYLFSTLDNVAFGGGSKISKNITGKIGVMQGNASDLMHGLPLQSVYQSDQEIYHEPIRLTVMVYAPKTYIDSVIKRHAILQKLFGNGWLHLICHDPVENKKFNLQRDMTWHFYTL